MIKKEVKKICFAASSGGHLDEISCLEKIYTTYDSFLVTENSRFQDVNIGEKTYYVNQLNRKERLFIIKFILLFIKSFYILNKESPDCIISTGALVTFPLCVVAKLLGKKVIYIESFARIETLSLTGKLIYRFADLFIVQWDELTKKYPKAIYRGAIY